MTQETAHMPLDERGLEAATDAICNLLERGHATEADLARYGVHAYLQTAAADVSGLERSIDQWRKMVPVAVTAGSSAQIEYALADAKHDIIALWATIQTLSASNAALEAENARLKACLAEAMKALIECEEYFDNRADADHDGIGFVANEEMKLQVMIRRVREGGKVE
jgi:hypothetical protein